MVKPNKITQHFDRASKASKESVNSKKNEELVQKHKVSLGDSTKW